MAEVVVAPGLSVDDCLLQGVLIDQHFDRAQVAFEVPGVGVGLGEFGRGDGHVVLGRGGRAVAEPGLGARTATLAMDRPAHGVVTYAHTGSGERLHGQDGNDFVYGYGGNASLDDRGSDDRLFGDVGNDLLRGGQGNDSVQGDAENDRLYGDQADDTLVGGAGRHSLFGGTGADRLHGGSGRDGLRYLASSTGVTVNPSTRSATDGHAQGDVFSDIENLGGLRARTPPLRQPPTQLSLGARRQRHSLPPQKLGPTRRWSGSRYLRLRGRQRHRGAIAKRNPKRAKVQCAEGVFLVPYGLIKREDGPP